MLNVVKGIGYLYKITNVVNGKSYVGQAVDYEKRWEQHRTALNNGTHYNAHLQRAWNTYGADSFTFELLDFSGRTRLNDEEITFIATYKSNDPLYGYNKTLGGGGGAKTEETKAKISEATKKALQDPAIRAKISEAQKGKRNRAIISDEQIAVAYRNTAHTDKYLAEMYGVSSKCINIIRRGINGIHVTSQINAEGFFHPAHLARLEAEKAGVNRSAPKPIAQLDKLTGAVIQVWESAMQAQRKGGFDNGNINSCCNGKAKTHKGYKWQYYTETQAGA